MQYIINKNINELRKEINKTKDLVVVEAGNENLNKFLVANQKIDIIFNFEKFSGRDYFNIRNSGLNQVVCASLKKNNIKVGFSFSEVLKKENKERAVLLGKMMQNVRFCKKYKVKMIFDNFSDNTKEIRDKVCLNAFARVLGF